MKRAFSYKIIPASRSVSGRRQRLFVTLTILLIMRFNATWGGAFRLVRYRATIIVQLLLDHHGLFKSETYNDAKLHLYSGFVQSRRSLPGYPD
jgi:hypothetical protein